jgi:hypothetical protein
MTRQASVETSWDNNLSANHLWSVVSEVFQKLGTAAVNITSPTMVIFYAIPGVTPHLRLIVDEDEVDPRSRPCKDLRSFFFFMWQRLSWRHGRIERRLKNTISDRPILLQKYSWRLPYPEWGANLPAVIALDLSFPRGHLTQDYNTTGTSLYEHPHRDNPNFVIMSLFPCTWPFH